MNTAPHKTLYRQICNSPYFQNVKKYLEPDDLRGVNKIRITTEEQIALKHNDFVVHYGFIPAGIFFTSNDALIISNKFTNEKDPLCPMITYTGGTLLHELGHYHGYRTNKHSDSFFEGFYFSAQDNDMKYYADYLNTDYVETFAGLHVLYKCGLTQRDATALFKGFGL